MSGPWEDYAAGTPIVAPEAPQNAAGANDGPWADYAAPTAPSAPAAAPEAPAHVLTPAPPAAPQAPGQPPRPGMSVQLHAPDRFSDNGKAPTVEGATRMEGHFGDDPSNEPVTKLTDAQHAEYMALAKDPKTTGAMLRAWAQRYGLAIANADQIIDARNRGAGVASNIVYQLPVRRSEGAGEAGYLGIVNGATLGLAARGAAVLDTIGIGSDRENIWNSNRGFGDLYDHNLDRERGVLQGAAEDHPIAYFGGNLVGGALAPIPTKFTPAGAFAAAERDALATGATAAEAHNIAASAARIQALKLGGATGAAYNLNSSYGSLGERAAQTALGGVEGAALGYVTGGAGYRSSDAPGVTPQRDGLAAADAAERLSGRGDGVDVNLTPPVVGGGITRRVAGGSDQTIFGHWQIDKSIKKLGGQLDAVNERTAANAGDVAPEAMTAEQAAARIADPSRPGSLASYEAESAAAKDAAYNAAISEAGDARLRTPKMIRFLDSKIQELRETPAADNAVQKLENLRETLANGQTGDGTWTVGGLRRFRTTYGDQLDANDGTVRGIAKQMWGQGSEDINNGLRMAGKNRAALAYRKADALNAERETNLEDIVPALLGKANGKSTEQVASSLVSMSRADGVRLSRALALMDDQHRSDALAGIIRNLGDDGGDFNPTTWARNWRNMSDESKANLFKGQTRNDLNDLATIIKSVQASGRAKNFSNTSGAENVIHILHQAARFGVEAGAGIVSGHYLVTPAISAGLGKAMASPLVARAMVAISRGQPRQKVMRLIAGAVSRNPAIRPDVAPLAQAITEHYDQEEAANPQ